MVEAIVRVAAARPLVDRLRDAARADARRRRRSHGVERLAPDGPRRARDAASSPRPSRAPSSGPSDARRLHQRTAGNPLFITETVRAIFRPVDVAGEHARATAGCPTTAARSGRACR